MNREDLKRLKGFKTLLHDSVKRGVDFIEKHHRHAAEKPFRVLESIKPIASPSKVVHVVHDGTLTLIYGGIRTVNRATETVDDWLVDRMKPEADDVER